jgi:hypothetical protein
MKSVVAGWSPTSPHTYCLEQPRSFSPEARHRQSRIRPSPTAAFALDEPDRPGHTIVAVGTEQTAREQQRQRLRASGQPTSCTCSTCASGSLSFRATT